MAIFALPEITCSIWMLFSIDLSLYLSIPGIMLGCHISIVSERHMKSAYLTEWSVRLIKLFTDDAISTIWNITYNYLKELLQDELCAEMSKLLPWM